MNKRIKKKKAKQAQQQELEHLEQELAKPSPEQVADIHNTISQAFYEFGKALGNALEGLVEFFKNLEVTFEGLVEFFKNLEVTFEETEQQGTSTTGPRTIQVPRYPANHRSTKTGVDNKKSRQPRRSFNRNQQTYRNCSYQARR